MTRRPMAHPLAESRRSLILQTASFVALIALVVVALPLLAPA